MTSQFSKLMKWFKKLLYKKKQKKKKNRKCIFDEKYILLN